MASQRKRKSFITSNSNGNFGDHKSLGQNLFELRFFFGSGYRIYYTIKNGQVIFLLTGEDKSGSSQKCVLLKISALSPMIYLM